MKTIITGLFICTSSILFAQNEEDLIGLWVYEGPREKISESKHEYMDALLFGTTMELNDDSTCIMNFSMTDDKLRWSYSQPFLTIMSNDLKHSQENMIYACTDSTLSIALDGVEMIMRRRNLNEVKINKTDLMKTWHLSTIKNVGKPELTVEELIRTTRYRDFLSLGEENYAYGYQNRNLQEQGTWELSIKQKAILLYSGEQYVEFYYIVSLSSNELIIRKRGTIFKFVHEKGMKDN